MRSTSEFQRPCLSAGTTVCQQKTWFYNQVVCLLVRRTLRETIVFAEKLPEDENSDSSVIAFPLANLDIHRISLLIALSVFFDW